VAGRGTTATVALERAGIPFTVHTYAHDPLPVVLDAPALAFTTVFCSGGRRGLEIELAPADLVRAANATVASIRAGTGTARG
jgi:prolyl-tRNA editing enzyme YbaK/EbsC (Cys-tRNA(Pro) deacylase)